jgi:hypothetical protein
VSFLVLRSSAAAAGGGGGSGIDSEPSIPGGAIWVDAAAANDLGSGTQASPKKLIASGAALLPSAGGGTLVIKDGTYSAAFANSSLKAVTGGALWTAPNVIRAENPGGAIVTGGLNISGTTNFYCQVRGIKFDDANEKDIECGNLKFFKCSFVRGATSGNTASVTIGTNNQTPGAHHILLEDCFGYGPGGRYNFLCYNSEDVVFRRCVARFDAGYNNIDGIPEGCFVQYDCQRISFQNCFAIDALGPRTVADTWAALYNAANGTTSISNTNKSWLGCAAIKHIRLGYCSEGQSTISNLTAQDIVLLGSGGSAEYGIDQLVGTSSLYERFTIFNQSQDGVGVFGGSCTVRDTVVRGCTGSAFNGVTPTTSVAFANGSNTGGTVIDPLTNGMLYLPRIEAASTLKTGGTSGQRGAQIVKRMGTSGTLYGETGYATLTTDDLWPWPNQTRIRSEMRAVTGMSTVDSERGFCATGETFTHYIFNQLGNGNPYP